jgi:ATP-dependent helicase/nuclease subunit A
MPVDRAQWTPQQLCAIETLGQNLLVSAAAGSGKTAVLAQRCAYLVCDAPEEHRCDIDQLLVVTFTNAAASEMRQRIGTALRERLLLEPENARLARQAALIDRAQISTLHGFCSHLLKQHFNILGIDPGFRTLVADEALLLRNEVARDLMSACYAGDDSGEFQEMIDDYGDGNDERVIGNLLRTHELLCGMVDRQQWIATAQARIAEASTGELVQSELGRSLLDLVRQKLAGFHKRCGHTAERFDRMQFPAHAKVVRQIMTLVQDCLSLRTVDQMRAEILAFKPSRLPPTAGSIPGKKQAGKLLKSIRDEIQPGGGLHQLLRFSSEEWQLGLRRIQSPCGQFLSLVSEFERRYSAAKREMRAVDFSDLERYALQILKDPSSKELHPSSIARLCREQFRYVQVDEYQDINAVQDAILALVSRDHATGGQNLFCVGDVKQSIYGFRLAEPRRFLQRDRLFRDNARAGRVVDLQKNFRSRAPLLESINCVFRRLMTVDAAELDYDRLQELVPGADYPSNGESCSFHGAPIEIHLLPAPPRRAPARAHDDDDDDDDQLDRTEHEAALVAHRIRRLCGLDGTPPMQVCQRIDGRLVSRDIKFRDIAVLLRTMRVKSDDFAEQLRLRGIPVHSQSATGFFQAMEVRDILSLLRLLDNQRQDVPMASVLRSPLSGLPNPDDCMARIRLAFPDAGGAMPFHQAVVNYARHRNDELSAALRELLAQLAAWRRDAHRRPLAELIWLIYDQTGYLAFCAGLESGAQRVANLTALYERAREFGTFQRQGLHRFMEFLQTLEEESDLGQPSIASEADNVVRIMSVHASKGLEFPVVFLADLGKKHNMQSATGSILAHRDAYLGLSAVDRKKRVRYPSLASVLVAERVRRQIIAEELRVLYVAMTRAREHLVLVGTCNADLPSQWRDAWGRHVGALPAETVLLGSTMLDWIGPAAAATAADNPNAFALCSYTEQEVSDIASASMTPRKLSKKQSDRADLIPLDPAPAMDETARQITDRICAPYPFEPFTRIAATQSVTSLTKHATTPAAGGASGATTASFAPVLAMPAFIAPAASATAVGVATHLALQHLDFSAASASADIAAQVQQMVARKLLLRDQAPQVDTDAIAWLMQTDLGALLRRHNKQVMRELPIYFAQETAPGSSDPLDRVMVRGRLDVLIDDGTALTIADYKTDRVTAQTIDARAAFYTPQLRAYRDAIAGITSARVAGVYLAFLQPRVLWSIT